MTRFYLDAANERRSGAFLPFAALLMILCGAFAARAQEPAADPPTPPPLAIEALLLHIAESPEGIVTVSEVETGGPAADLDIREGDILVGVGDGLVSSYNDVVAALAAAQPGEELVLRIRRDDEALEKRIVAPAEAGLPFGAIVERSEFQMLGMKLVKDERGRVVVAEVSPETPAEAAGAKVNDVIVNFGGHKVRSIDELFAFAVKLTRRMAPGSELELVVLRGDEQEKLVAVMSDPSAVSIETEEGTPTAAAEAEIVFCMAVRESAGRRVTVVEIMEHSPAALAGILPGDIIVSVADEKVRSVEDLAEIIQLQTQGDQVPFGILRGEELQITEVLMAPCQEQPVADAATLDALDSQVRLLEAQVEELRRTVDVLRGTIQAMRGGGVSTP